MSKSCKRGHSGDRFLSGGCKQCAKDKHKERYVPKPRGPATGAKARLPDGRRRVDTVEWKMLWSAKNRATRKGLPFDLQIEDIVIPEICPVLGIAVTKPSLDRKKNDLGYVRGNIKVISDRANRIKSDATVEEIEAIARYMRSTVG